MAIEDRLLYTLCDSNEFQANMLMRSAGASFGKMESDRLEAPAQRYDHKTHELEKVADVSHKLIPEMDADGKEKAQTEHRKTTNRFGAQEYAEYMQKRVRIYKKTFKDGTKKQKRLFRKLKRKAMLWKMLKAEDHRLTAKFADKNMGIMRTIKATGPYKAAMGVSMPDYSGTHIDPKGSGATMDQAALLEKLQEKIKGDGLLGEGQLEDIKSIPELFNKVKEAKATAAKLDSLEKPEKPKPIKPDQAQAQSFWDRLYGGVDFNWENSTGYYPDGLGIILTGGYKITDNAGLNLEVNTLVNAGEIGWPGDDSFQPKFIANYSAGANLDHRLWKILYAGLGAELIVNTVKVPARRFISEIQNPKYTLGLPLILKAIVPIAGSKSTTLELRYDLNSQNNVKPKFDFQVGFLIGR